ncbi:hypothetical protein [Amycolatopsis sp. ATCC 39116]|uniref:DUF7878 domain-containing protein n=1 Tax=Amycolatopsis sp. (strain ATCC 39116 / 75iv2) TaxID=385957 RepID=UPI0002FD2898|nr:hypothetical protein [Amycolatopsis sp. ATCC 39116]
MELRYSALAAPDLHGRSEAEVFVQVEADLVVRDGAEIYSEGAFPVVELAAALREWQTSPARGDFELTSLSLEDRWQVRIVAAGDRWRVVDDVTGAQGALRPLAEIDSAIDAFVDALRADCTREFGPWIDRFFHPAQN